MKAIIIEYIVYISANKTIPKALINFVVTIEYITRDLNLKKEERKKMIGYKSICNRIRIPSHNTKYHKLVVAEGLSWGFSSYA